MLTDELVAAELQDELGPLAVFERAVDAPELAGLRGLAGGQVRGVEAGQVVLGGVAALLAVDLREPAKAGVALGVQLAVPGGDELVAVAVEVGLTSRMQSLFTGSSGSWRLRRSQSNQVASTGTNMRRASSWLAAWNVGVAVSLRSQRVEVAGVILMPDQ